MEQAGEVEQIEPSISAPKSPSMEKPHYWSLVVNWKVSSGGHARHAMVEDSEEGMMRDTIHDR